MGRLLHNCKGAVTVIVTLLLIPAILISGTAVDVARVYSAKSTLQDANQLAANSVLASYDALLQDLYGLFAVMQNDPEFGTMVSDYVEMAVNGEDWVDRGMGTFQLFYGSDLQPGEITPAAGQHLGNVAVLRRQIEEYAKFRAPAIVAELLLEKLDVFQKVQEDAKVIKKKLEVDDGVEELEKYYKKIYDRANSLAQCRQDEKDIMAQVSSSAATIKKYFESISEIRVQYNLGKKDLADAKADLASAGSDADISALNDKIKELEDDLEELETDYDTACLAIQEASGELEKQCKAYQKTLKNYLDELDDLLKECETAEEKKAELQTKLESMRSALDSGKCSDVLREGIMEPEKDANGREIDGKSVLDRYEDLLIYDVEQMGIDMDDADRDQIENTIQVRMLKADIGGYVLIELKDMSISAIAPLEGEAGGLDGILSASTSHSPDPGRDGTGFLRFEEISAESKRFYQELKTIYSDEEGKGAKKKNLTSSVTKILAKAQDVFSNLIFDPEGAEYLTDGTSTTQSGTGTSFGSSGDWSKEDKGKEELEKALDSDFLGKLANSASEAGNKVLLIVYDTEMFSDASTPGEDEGEKKGYPKENMAGIPLTTDVNYYFQSELEYLYNGDLSDAVANLRSVAGMLLLVRFVFNYVASFSVNGVNSIVRSIKAALAWTGPFAILAGELARLGLSVGESALDVARLRNGENVAIFKTDKTWKLSISGLVNVATEGITDAALDNAFDLDHNGGSDTTDDEGVTLSYTDYMRLFLMLVSGDTLAERTGKLIELNVTNRRNGINADEDQMAAAERFDLTQGITGFSLTTTVDLRMLFLSMPFAQKGINGVVPPKTLAISATDYRGY